MPEINDSVFEFIDSPEEVDLTRDAVIEASAGTGKTYTIIELVMRLLTIEKLPLEQILLVTFTDKATAELRTRIREGIHSEINKETDKALGVETLAHLDRAMKQVSSAPIYTINAFCQNMLREFAFEQGGVFEFELIDDNEVFKQQINQLKRQWPSDPSIKKAFNKLGKSPKEVEGLLLDLLGNINLERDLLWPAPELTQSQLLPEVVRWADSVDFSQFETEIAALPSITTRTRNNLIKNVTQAWSMLKEVVQSCHDADDFVAQFKNTYSTYFDVDKKACLLKYHKDWLKKADAKEISQAPLFNEMVEQLGYFHNQIVGADYAIISSLIKDIKDRAKAYKLNNGLISYDDMINRLHEQVMAEQALPPAEQLLTQQMRKKFKVAMIDEFQDTSFNQWEIFKTLFFDSPGHQLTVIGDPKQSIYAFRGADVHTYLDAKNDMLTGGKSGGKAMANGYRLATNYRSLPALLSGLNQFFGDEVIEQEAWWRGDEVVVSSPPPEHIEEQGPKVLSDPSDTQPINSYAVEGENMNADDFKQAMANQVALIVQEKILKSPIEVKIKGKDRALTPSDVCVLVSAAKEAEFLEKAFNQLGIPHNYHKKKDLYSSEEALHYQILLTALAHDHDRRRVNNALVTLFFGLKPAQLKDFADELLPDVNQHWLALKEAVADGDWLRLFDLLLNQSGVLMKASHAGLTRRVANLKHIKQILCETALANNLDAKALLQWLIEKREAKSSEDLHQKDSDRQAVNIMTMHVSKGLEFPVVFLFGGFGLGSKQRKYSKYRDDVSGKIVYDINKDNDAEFKFEAEERQRLFYVAMTRAVIKLFLPVYEKEQQYQSPESHYLLNVVKRYQQLATSAIENKPQQAILLDDSCLKDADVNGINFNQSASKATMPDSPLSPPQHLWLRQRKVYSFSSISHNNSKTNQASSFGESSEVEKAEITGDLLAHNPQPVDWTKILPGGVKTGHVLHGIFEHVDFQSFKDINDLSSLWENETIMAVVDEQMAHFSMDNGDILNDEGAVLRDHRKELAAWVWHTLKKPLDALNGGVLADVLPQDRCHEMQFFWQKEQTHLTGFIDLLFAVKTESGRDYFILDWKSNYSALGYAPETLNHEVMAEHQYHWQYQLYAMAVQKWFDSLNLNGARLAGALYLFSRGIDSGSDDQNGVFFDDFTASGYSSKMIERELLHITQNKSGVKS